MTLGGGYTEFVFCGRVVGFGRGIGRFYFIGRFFVREGDVINSVIFLVFCLFFWNGLMDANNY